MVTQVTARVKRELPGSRLVGRCLPSQAPSLSGRRERGQHGPRAALHGPEPQAGARAWCLDGSLPGAHPNPAFSSAGCLRV